MRGCLRGQVWWLVQSRYEAVPMMRDHVTIVSLPDGWLEGCVDRDGVIDGSAEIEGDIDGVWLGASLCGRAPATTKSRGITNEA